MSERQAPSSTLEVMKRLNINSEYGATKNAYYNSEIVVITDDSFSMISEAIQSGIKPIVIKTGNIGKRLLKGINILESRKKIN